MIEVKSPWNLKTLEKVPQNNESQVESILLKRMAKPSEVASLVMFLAGDENEYITGQTIIIDGGFSIKNE